MLKYNLWERAFFACQQCLLVDAIFSYLLKTCLREMMFLQGFKANLDPFFKHLLWSFLQKYLTAESVLLSSLENIHQKCLNISETTLNLEY